MVSGLRQTGMRAGTWAGRQAMVQVAAVAMGGSARATDMVGVHGVHGLSTELTFLHVGCFDGACVAAGGTVDSALMAPTFPGETRAITKSVRVQAFCMRRARRRGQTHLT